MRVAIVTWISYNNIGTHLQAYALQQIMKKHKINNAIINDDFITHKNRDKGPNNTAQVDIVKESRYKRLLKKYIFHPLQLVKDIKNNFDVCRYNTLTGIVWNSSALIQNFRLNSLNIYNTDDSNYVNDLNNDFDVFVCGSDQIWSLVDRNFNGYYYLDFTQKKKISYAPSVGTKNISREKSFLIKKWLSDFSAISVREIQTATMLSELLEKEIDFVADPTLLHDSKFWGDFCSDVCVKRKKYIVCYFLSDNAWYFEYAQSLSKYLRMNLILIPNKVEFIDKKWLYKYPVGPKEFVSLIKNSEFVLTDSYHATIFSLIFEKNFLHLKRFSDGEEHCQNIRIESLFGYLQIDKSVISEKPFEKDDLYCFDYNEINSKIEALRERSLNFLMENLDI